MRLLLISNSTNAGEEYLKYPIGDIAEFLSCANEVLFIPYAAVTFSYDEYAAKVQRRFDEIDIRVRSIHREADPVRAVMEAEAVVVGGGNTFALIKKMQEQRLLGPLHERIMDGLPYVGWSAGSNVACPTIRTTNDMPIVEPESFRAIGAVGFQINPHYLDANPAGHRRVHRRESRCVRGRPARGLYAACGGERDDAEGAEAYARVPIRRGTARNRARR